MVAAVNRYGRQFLSDDGRLWPITRFFDEDGEPCEPWDAVSAVAGSGNDWFAIDLTEFTGDLS